LRYWGHWPVVCRVWALELLSWHGREQQTVSFRPPNLVLLTPHNGRVPVLPRHGLLFLLQALVGGASQHYRADISNFFGIDLARLLPFNIARTWHLQLAIFWSRHRTSRLEYSWHR